MDRENDSSPGGSDQPNATLTDRVGAPVAPPRPAVPASYAGVIAASATAPVSHTSPDVVPVDCLKLPLPLKPSRYGIAERAPEETAPKLRPSVAATLPPPLIEMLDAPAPVLQVADDAAPPVDNSRLMLAPEAHVPRGRPVSFGRDPADAMVRIDGPGSHPASLPTQSQPAVGRFDPIRSSADAPLRIEPAFASQTHPERSAVAATPSSPLAPVPARPASHYVRTAAKYAVYAAVAYLGLVAFLILAYRVVNPPMSSLMLQQWISGQPIAQSWADIDEISPQVVRAVLLSEDGRFCEHTGVDFDAMQDAIERAGDGAPRGASTISMQVVKNLFLWPSKSYLRKAIEIPLTWAMELVWPKRRIMEIYLNIAEWGPGIFGVEAASQFHFQKSARRLNEREAAQLAVSLPNPYMRDAGDPGPKTRRLASDIQARMRNAYASQTSCVLKPGAGR